MYLRSPAGRYSATPARELRMTGDAFGHRKAAKNVVILYDILKGGPGTLSAERCASAAPESAG
jgi:hypothetical protein